MNKYINNEKKNIIMGNTKNYLIIMALFILLPFSYAEQTHLVWYPMESQSTTTVFDSSGNNINAVLVNGASPSTTFLIWGARNLQCDGTNDYGISSTTVNLPTQYSVSLWVRPSSSITKDYWTTLDDGVYTAFELEYDGTNNVLELGYYNDNGTYTHRNIDNSIFASATWYHILITIDTELDQYSYYKNGQLIINNGLFPDGYSYNATTLKDIHLCINRDFNATKIYGGKIDEYRLFNFRADPNQALSLYNSNNITFYADPVIETPISSVVITNIINSSSISENESFLERNIFLDVFLNEKANCEIYLDNQLLDTSSDILAFRVLFDDLEIGTHTYYLYCSNTNGTVLQYETVGTFDFQILPPAPYTLTFNVIGNDFNVNDESLYIVSPCMIEGYNVIGVDKPKFRPEYNKGGIQFAKVKNGLATLTLNTSSNEFCLFNGEVRYNSENVKQYTYDIVTVHKQIDLGIIETPNNVTANYYSVPVDKFEIYGIATPEAYNEKWSGSLILGILMFIIGCLVIWGGMVSNNGKIVVAGALILLIGTGFSIGGLFGVLI